MRIGHLLGFLELAGKDQIADLREVLARLGIVVVVRTAGPETGLVQRDALLSGAAEDHRPHEAVAERHGVQPLLARLAIPQDHLARCFSRLPFRPGGRRRGGRLEHQQGRTDATGYGHHVLPCRSAVIDAGPILHESTPPGRPNGLCWKGKEH